MKSSRKGPRKQVEVLSYEKGPGGPEFVIDLCRSSRPSQILVAKLKLEETLAATVKRVKEISKPQGSIQKQEELLNGPLEAREPAAPGEIPEIFFVTDCSGSAVIRDEYTNEVLSPGTRVLFRGSGLRAGGRKAPGLLLGGGRAATRLRRKPAIIAVDGRPYGVHWNHGRKTDSGGRKILQGAGMREDSTSTERAVPAQGGGFRRKVLVPGGPLPEDGCLPGGAPARTEGTHGTRAVAHRAKEGQVGSGLGSRQAGMVVEMVKLRKGREGETRMRRFIFSAFVLGLLACVSQGPVQADHFKGAFISERNGDVNGDGFVDLSDPVYLLNFMYLGGTEPALLTCAPFNVVENGDIDGSGQYEVTDPIRLLSFLYLGGLPPVEGCPES